ncbi:dehydrogenase E1 component-domain-containing protein [Dichotomocladium elegans]|nr:dehydrogenase E1 component-domain-containing protein [Dichotomocladium elegans]
MLYTVSKYFIPRPIAFSTRALSVSATCRNTDKTYTVSLPESSFKMYKADAPDLNVQVTQQQLLHMFTKMTTVRRMEMTADNLYKARKIRGFCHLSTGQEAVPVGMEEAITHKDQIITAYRCHGFTYIRGAPLKGIFAELMGRRDGLSKGKGGSMHIFGPSFFGGHGIVGAQVPLGAGLAFANKYLDNKAATFTLYGDGAANQGQVFEAFNMAKLWDLPCVFVCENNKYGMGTSDKRSSASIDYYTRGDYIPGIRVNGMDVLAVYRASQWAKEWVTSGKGPLVMEVKTYRYSGHSMSDPGTTYRSREEIQHMRSSADAITGLKHLMIDLGAATEEELKAIDKECHKVVDDAAKEADASPEPDISSFWTDVYIEGSEPDYLRGRIPSETHHYR